jgi:hypothetical protein
MRREKPLPKRVEQKIRDQDEAFRLWETAPDYWRLEKRWGIDFHISLCHLPRQWIGTAATGHWQTTRGDMKTFGDLRNLLREAYAEMEAEHAGAESYPGR